MDHRNPPNALVHFYRAAVMHADVWRQRLDATTNWAVVTTAAVITFAFGGRDSAAVLVLLALVFDFFFLFMEARRYQSYNIWQRRIRMLHRNLIGPALRPPDEVDSEQLERNLKELAEDLGRNVPAIPLWGAFGYRIRRNYGPLVTLVILVWLLKLYIHPDVADGLAEFIERAHVGPMPGLWVVIAVGLFFLVFIGLAVKAPSEQMLDWSAVPAPIERIMPGKILPGTRPRPRGGRGRRAADELDAGTEPDSGERDARSGGSSGA